ncbi:oligosaccharide flippase family protein [Nocardioides sp. 616]|uniref:oligosaccharide flippase family protein n=1 Tax=Nocardioides sp. 616 TaxID=2268090 RepID=UPI0013B3882A|nr:oligosaccharide flippase family protein [Nocardioides sp. 616]
MRPVLLLGISSVIVAVSAVVRQKVVADLLGATGVGTLGLMTAVSALATTLFGLGLGTSGVPAIASARERQEELKQRARSLLILSAALAAFAFVVVGLSTRSESLTGISDPPWQLRLAMAGTVASAIFTAGQLAFLNGRGRLAVMAACNSLGAIVGTAASVLGLYFFGYTGLAVALLGVPVATALLAYFFVRQDYARLPSYEDADRPRAWPHVKQMTQLGAIVTTSLVIGVAAQLVARLVIQNDLGLEGVGYYQASWAISGMYLSFLLTALAAEYFPRVSALGGDRDRVSKALDDQIILTVALAAPLIAWGITLAPAILRILYAPDFVEASDLLRWQLAADVFKLPAWAIGFVLLATDRRLLFFMAEVSWNVVFLALLVPFSREWGLAGVGVATLCAYGVYLVVCVGMAHRLVGFRPSRLSGALFALSSLSTVALLLSAFRWGEGAPWLAPMFAALLTVTLGLVAWAQIRNRRAAPDESQVQTAATQIGKLL